jgi:hypothetical protein
VYTDYGYTIYESGAFGYGSLLALFGLGLLLLWLLILISPKFGKKMVAKILWIVPILTLFLSIILVGHMMSQSETINDTYYEISSVYPDVGFYLTSIGSILAIIGGSLISRQVSKMAPMPSSPPPSMGAPYGQPQGQFPPQQQYQQYPPQQYQ